MNGHEDKHFLSLKKRNEKKGRLWSLGVINEGKTW